MKESYLWLLIIVGLLVVLFFIFYFIAAHNNHKYYASLYQSCLNNQQHTLDELNKHSGVSGQLDKYNLCVNSGGCYLVCGGCNTPHRYYMPINFISDITHSNSPCPAVCMQECLYP